MFGLPQIPWGLLGVAGGTDARPTNTPEDMSSLQKLYASVVAHNRTPNGRVARGFDQFGPMAAPPAPQPQTPVPAMGGLGLFPGAPQMAQSPLQTAVATPSPLPGDTPPQPPALSAQAMIPPAAPPHGVPMPTARPADAPQAPPDMSWFQRNAAMMRDPSSGAFIDPVNADRAQASGPDVINKLLSYFHTKET